MIRLGIIALFLLAIGFAAIGQQSSFINYNVNDGLAQSQAMVLHQDLKGYIWIGTASGLSRFNGAEFVNFSKSDGLLDNQINSIAEDPNGALYFGCPGGVSVWNGARFRSYLLPENLQQYKVTAMNWLQGGALWIGTDGAGFLRFDPGNESFSKPSKESGAYINWLSSDEMAFVGSKQGFFLDNELVAEVLDGISITDAAIKDGRIYLASNQGLFVIDDKWKNYTEEDGLIYDQIRHMHLASDGSVWLATRRGVSRFIEGRFDNFTKENGMPYANIRDVIEDDEGNIWLASNGQGIYRYTGGTFQTYKEGVELESDKIMSILGTSDDLLLGTFDKGLQAFSEERGVGFVEGVLKTDIWSLLRSRDGRLWVGSSNGLHILDGEKLVYYSRQNGLSSNRITALYEDRDGLVWAGHRSGVTVFNGSEFRNLGEKDSFEGKRVRSICQGADGRLWFGAENGLFSYFDAKFERYTEDNGLVDNTVYTLTCDRLDRLWIGTKNGLNLMQDNEIMSLEIAKRFNANNINFLHESQKNQLLVGTNNGLYRLDLDRFGKGEVKFSHYGLSEGLPGLECNLNSVHQLEDGSIWFGTNNGLVRCQEDDLLRTDLPLVPKAQITDIRLFGDAFDVSAHSDSIDMSSGLPVQLTLSHAENHITFDFGSVAFRHPEDMLYSYYLEGVDDNWIPPSNINTVSYSSLKPGNYTLRLRTFDLAGRSSKRLTSFAFEIRPPFYLTWWFILLEFIAAALAIWGIFNWRKTVVARRRENRELGLRTRMFSLEQQSLNSSMNRHFIFNALNSIQFYINHEDKRSANRYLSSFAKLIRMNLDSTSSTWVSLKDELDRLELYLSLEHMRYKHRFDYQIQVAEGLNAAGVRIPSMMLQPFLENSIWHGILHKEGRGNVSVKVSRENSVVSIMIEDDGIGIEQSLAKKGNANSGHQSRGVEITNDRIQLFKKMTSDEFEIIGPYQLEENGEVLGTRVEIKMPFIPLSEVIEMQKQKFEFS